MGRKCTKADKAQRITKLVKLISNGAVTSDLVQYCAYHWGLQRRQSDNYIAEARKVIIEDINRDRQIVVAEMISTCHEIIKRGMHGKNYNAVLGAMNRIAALGGLDQTK